MSEADHLAHIRDEEAAVVVLEESTRPLVATGRAALGTGGATGPVDAMRSGVRRSDGGAFLVTALASFLVVEQLLQITLTVLAPEITAGLGISLGSYTFITTARITAAGGIAFRLGAIAARNPRSRRRLVFAATFLAGVGTIWAAFATSFWALFLAINIGGLVAGVAWVAHRPLLMDGYPPPVRVRVMTLHQAGVVIGAAASPLLIVLLAGPMNLSWRGVVLVVGVLTLLVSLLGLRLTDSPVGRYDTDEVRRLVSARNGPAGDADEHPDGSLRYFETMRRSWLIPSMRRLLWGWAVLGLAVAPLPIYMSNFLEDHWTLDLTERSIVFALAWAMGIPMLWLTGVVGERLFAAHPRRVLGACSMLLLVVAIGLVVSAVSPVLALTTIAFGVVLGGSAALVGPLTVTTFSLVQPRSRPVVGVLIALFFVTVGGQGGGLLLRGLDRRFGTGTAIALLAVPAFVAALVVWRARTSIDADLDQVVVEVVEAEEIRDLVRSGSSLPMLACRGIDFAYGQLQVLFDVDFTVDDGEVVALLGTNGAGKSTLLRVISGLGLPSRGSVRLCGSDITYIDTERRVGMGITQISGGRAVFNSLTVAENLRAYAYTQRRNRRAVEAGIDAAFAAFPHLASCRDQRASTLSGGEQQMLGLASALIVRPRLLLIDELSLGLAPIVVGELLDMVRAVNEAGTAVVLIEQSVNIALSFVEHAYFMEKGEIRFDGRAAELLERPDLLRSVFLDGAAAAL